MSLKHHKQIMIFRFPFIILITPKNIVGFNISLSFVCEPTLRMCERVGAKIAERDRTSVERGAVAVSRHGVELVLVIRPPLSYANS